jgi:hypothetical protein
MRAADGSTSAIAGRRMNTTRAPLDPFTTSPGPVDLALFAIGVSHFAVGDAVAGCWWSDVVETQGEAR